MNNGLNAIATKRKTRGCKKTVADAIGPDVSSNEHHVWFNADAVTLKKHSEMMVNLTKKVKEAWEE